MALESDRIIAIKKSFKNKYPNVVLGFRPSSEKNVVQIEARAVSDEHLKDIPEEYEGCPVNKGTVSESRYNQMVEFEKVGEENAKN